MNATKYEHSHRVCSRFPEVDIDSLVFVMLSAPHGSRFRSCASGFRNCRAEGAFPDEPA